ncbi:hypothetical protein HMPREF1981_01924 [Bacteroides pyogenes F0041]|uniref:Uncharacterized protein n=1 Tax=Bacteroides pyogenes F0041 TaxID=1321819 RepID=U2DUC8_9BACE|nr:hypothetical protein HMPREF1981_01924 [Bacteroides pyogenes F0041]
MRGIWIIKDLLTTFLFCYLVVFCITRREIFDISISIISYSTLNGLLLRK